MIVKDGKIIAIDHVEVDGVTITGDGVFSKKYGGKPLGIGPGVTSAVSGAVLSAVSGQVGKQIDQKVSSLSSTIDKKLSTINSNIERLDSKIDSVSEKLETVTTAFTAFKNTAEEQFDNISDWSEEVDEKIKELSARPAGSSAFLSKDLFVTNEMGMIPKYSTIPMGTPLENIWTSALTNEIKPAAGSLSLNISTKNELPGSKTLSIISFKATAGNLPITGYAFKIGNGTVTSGTTMIPGVDESGQHTGTMTSSVSFTTSSDFSVYASAFDGKNTVVANTSVLFFWPYFYGETDVSSVDLSALKKISETKSDKTVNFGAVGKYLVFAYDNKYTDLKSALDKNNFETLNGFVKTTATYAGHEYKVYVSNEKKTYTGKYSFIHG